MRGRTAGKEQRHLNPGERKRCNARFTCMEPATPGQACIPEHQVRWRWTKDSVAIWDNGSTQHYAVMDYPPCHRRMDRATVVGDRPF